MTKFVILPLRILQVYLAIYVHYLWHCHFLGVYAERFLLSLRLSQWAVWTLCHSKCRQTTAHTMEKKNYVILHWCYYEESQSRPWHVVVGAVCKDPIEVHLNYNLSATYSWYCLAFSIHTFDRRGHEREALLSHGSWLNYHMITCVYQVIWSVCQCLERLHVSWGIQRMTGHVANTWHTHDVLTYFCS